MVSPAAAWTDGGFPSGGKYPGEAYPVPWSLWSGSHRPAGWRPAQDDRVQAWVDDQRRHYGLGVRGDTRQMDRFSGRLVHATRDHARIAVPVRKPVAQEETVPRVVGCQGVLEGREPWGGVKYASFDVVLDRITRTGQLEDLARGPDVQIALVLIDEVGQGTPVRGNIGASLAGGRRCGLDPPIFSLHNLRYRPSRPYRKCKARLLL
jgi:hypothetical protein